MADLYDDNVRNSANAVDDADPLAELARIIGYERPGAEPAAAAPKSGPVTDHTDEIDLEAELLADLQGDAPALDHDYSTASDANLEDELDAEFDSAFDDFADEADLQASDETAIETQAEWTQGAADTDLDVDEDVLAALEDELTISEDELSIDAPEAVGDDAEDVAFDFDIDETPSPAAQYEVEQTPAHDDDILADMSRFDIPAHTAAAAGYSAAEPFVAKAEDAAVELEEEPELESEPEPFSALETEPDFESDLSAELDDYSAHLTSSPQPVAADDQDAFDTEFDEAAFDADFEMATANLSVDDDIELDEPDTVSLEDSFAPPDADEGAPGDDEIAAAFFDLIPEEGATQQSASSENEHSISAIEDEFDAFFPQQPIDTVAPEATADVVRNVAADQDPYREENWLDELSEADGSSVRLHDANDGEDAFDPTAIADIGTAPEAVDDIDVPVLPIDEPFTDADLESALQSDLDREFADLVEDEGVYTGAAAGLRGTETVAKPSFDDLEGDLGFAEGNLSTEMPYRPRPVPVDADAPILPVAETSDQEASRGRAPLVAGVVLGAALLFGGAALGWSWLSSDSGSSEGPMIIRADTEPVKVAPENPGGTQVPNQDKAVYDQVAGNSGAGTSQPRLVDSAEEPVDVVQRTIDPSALPLENQGEPGDGKMEERLTEGDTATNADANPESMVAPRKVRTMIVKSDGTIVAREDPAPAVPETAAATAVDATPAAPETMASEPVVPAAAADEPKVTAVAEPATAVAATDALTNTQTETETGLPAAQKVRTVAITKPPVPQSRPAEQPVNVVGQVTETGRVTQAPDAPAPAQQQVAAATPAPAATAPANPGGYYVQIASQPSSEGAQASYNNLSRRFASVIGGRGVDYQRADIPGKGTYYRVRIPAGSRDEANALCARYKSAGGSCLVAR